MLFKFLTPSFGIKKTTWSRLIFLSSYGLVFQIELEKNVTFVLWVIWKKWILFLFNSSEFQWKIIDIWIQLFAMGGWGFQRIQNKSTFYFHCTGGFLFDYGCMLSSSLNPTICLYLWEIEIELFSLCTTPHHTRP